MSKTMSKFTICAISLSALLLVATQPTLGGDKAEGHLMVMPDEIEWSDVGSMPPGAKAAVIEGDPSTAEQFTMRIEFPANYTIPLHTHPAVERVTVLDGTLYFGVGDTFDREKAHALTEGTLAVMDPGVPMYGYTKDEPAVIQLNGVGPWGIEYLDPSEDPRQSSE